MTEQNLVIRLDSKLKEQLEMCAKNQDTTTSQLVRSLIRKSIDDWFSRAVAQTPVVFEEGVFVDRTDPTEVESRRRLAWLANRFLELNPGVELLDYRERESRKLRGYELGRSKNSLEVRVNGALEIMRSHFARSVLSTFDIQDPTSYKTHPSFDVYAAHYVWGWIEPTSPFPEFGSDVPTELRRRYPQVERSCVPSHTSYWIPPTDS